MVENQTVQPNSSLLTSVEARSGEKVSLCYQCRKCTNGCPLTFAMDFMPNQVMRMIQLGLEEELLRSKTIWVCASCQTCTARCPNDIDIAHLMDTLRQLGEEAGVPAGEANVVKFHKALLGSIRRHGRLFEVGMLASYKLAARDFLSDPKLALKDAKLALMMLKRGKLKFWPKNIQGKAEVREMFPKPRKG